MGKNKSFEEGTDYYGKYPWKGSEICTNKYKLTLKDCEKFHQHSKTHISEGKRKTRSTKAKGCKIYGWIPPWKRKQRKAS